MIASTDDPPPSLWRELLLVLAPAVATAIVYELGETVRDVMRARREERKKAGDGLGASKG